MSDTHNTAPVKSGGALGIWTILTMILLAGCFALQQVIIVHHSKPYDFYFGLNENCLKHFYLWQVFTYQLLHFGWIHFVLNLAFLWIVGRQVERRLGTKGYLLVFWGAVLGGGVFQAVIVWVAGLLPASMDGVAIYILDHFGYEAGGASAGPLGLLAAFCLMPSPPWISLVAARRALWVAALAAVALIAVSNTTKVAHLAHFGALLTGIAIARTKRLWA